MDLSNWNVLDNQALLTNIFSAALGVLVMWVVRVVVSGVRKWFSDEDLPVSEIVNELLFALCAKDKWAASVDKPVGDCNASLYCHSNGEAVMVYPWALQDQAVVRIGSPFTISHKLTLNSKEARLVRKAGVECFDEMMAEVTNRAINAAKETLNKGNPRSEA